MYLVFSEVGVGQAGFGRTDAHIGFVLGTAGATAEVGHYRVQTGMCDKRCGCLERLAAAASQHTQVRTSTTDALAREGGQMIQGKKLVQSMFARSGYRIVRLESDAQYRPTAADARQDRKSVV